MLTQVSADGPAWALEASALGKRYGSSLWALNGISLTVPWGKVTGLVGPNAAGKSTLIKTWIGFERPTTGEVAVAGHDPVKERDAAVASLAYLPQSPALYRDLTVAEHLSVVAHLRPSFDLPLAVRRLDDLAIPSASIASQLSGGQAAQVGLALALGSRAPILLLDEPLSSLDPLARREFLDVLRDGVQADGLTAVLSSHVVRDVEQGCDRILVLGTGRLLLEGSLQEVVSTHRIGLIRAGERPSGFVADLPGTQDRLLRVGDEPEVGETRPATLEDVVMGYLAKGRSPAANGSGIPVSGRG